MADRPILFSAPMIRALLDGRKTQTRRALRLPKKTYSCGPIYERPDMSGWEPTTSGGGGCFTMGKAGERIPTPEQIAIWHRTTGVCMALPIQPGDRLWIREAWAINDYRYFALIPKERPADLPDDSMVYFATESDGEILQEMPRRPSIHMPRWASRLTLIVTDVRVQRLQEISEEDSMAEGILQQRTSGWFSIPGVNGAGTSPRAAFALLWNSINGAESWQANPWVAAYTFTVHKANIDAMQTPPLAPEKTGGANGR